MSEIVRIEIPSANPHWGTDKRKYKKTDYYCVDCGKQTVWDNLAEGDYYVGSDFTCTSCGSQINLCGGGKSDIIAKAITEALTTTPKDQRIAELEKQLNLKGNNNV